MKRGLILILIACILFLVAFAIISAALPYTGPFAHAATPISVHGVGSIAVISWLQPPEADTALILRQRQPQLVEALRLISGPQQAIDDETAPGDVYWIAFWNDSSYVETSGRVSVRWEQRLIFP